MLDEAELRRRLRDVRVTSIHGPFSRFVAFRHLVSSSGNIIHSEGARPLWGIGSVQNGGRYNFPRKFEAVYLAEDPVTALAEVQMLLAGSTAGMHRIKNVPLVHISVDGILLRVLDLTVTSNQETLATNHQELTGEWRLTQAGGAEAPTQLLGRIAFESEHFEAIRFPSSKHAQGICVAVFPDRLVVSSDAFISVYDPDGNLAQRIPTGMNR